MNSKVLHSLEFDKIINRLTEFASSPLGKKYCEETVPISDIDEIRTLQTETTDALSMLWQKGSISFSGNHDITESIKLLEVGGVLSNKEFLRICSVLNTTRNVKNYSKALDNSDATDSLTGYFLSLEPLTTVCNEISRCILSEEEIADDASPALSDIRRLIKKTNEKVHSVLGSLVNSMRTYLQDGIITMRNGRYCLPVKADSKSMVSGMVHDQSSTGSTLFIEPASVVNLNNELKQLSIKENEEIERILATLSETVAAHSEQLYLNYQTLGKLDYIFSRAAYSKALKCNEPVFNTDGIINLKCARHPLLDPKTVVPTNIPLGENYNQLIITGPNTGGKTVSLKTVGLLTLMGQAGLHIPADEGSTLSVFTEVFADIGDEQSIEQSLSTFSSHMKNIINIINHADTNSLVLFDELCAGTDPVEGAALAISILSFLNNMGVRTMSTTHYSELKVYALSTPGVENACCEFSVETLSPTYKLLIGIPGKSNAFAISLKLGLPGFIIDDAKNRLADDSKSFEDVITDLNNSKAIIEQEQAEITAYKAEISALKAELQKKSEHLDDRRESILRQANEEARAILQEAKSYTDETIKEVTRLAKDGSNGVKALEGHRSKLRDKMKATDSKLALKNTKTTKAKHKLEDFKPGTLVKVLSLNLNGTINGTPNSKGDVYVQMGILRSLINIKDLEIIEESSTTDKKLTKTNQSKIKMSKSLSVSTEVNLIGMTTDEAISVLDKYLDDAYLAHLSSVRVIHGRGTGALKNAVHSHLKRQKYVKEFRLGTFGEGDMGVTIVEFK